MLYETNMARCLHGAPPLVWNDKLAASTYKFFKNARSLRHSKSYKLNAEEGGPAGENLAMASNGLEPARAVKMWYDEVKDCGPMPGCKRGSSGTTGHFTALVWKGARVLGCALSTSKKIIACRYGEGPGSKLSQNTPNMGGGYESNVLSKRGTTAECAKNLPRATEEA